jgi:hypothetical protein
LLLPDMRKDAAKKSQEHRRFGPIELHPAIE